MKNLYQFFLLSIIVMAFQANAQIINVNPDPNGEPWWAGGAVAPEPGAWSDAIEFVPTPESYALTLPPFVYNNDLKYFPGIYLQLGQSCVQVDEIWYAFTYEINRKRDLDASDIANQYNALYTYNFLNKGSGNNYTLFGSGFGIIKQNGCPSWNVFEDPALHDTGHPDYKFKYWMTEHEKYKAGMYNTIDAVYSFQYNTFPDWFINIKHWIADHGIPASTGGLAIIGVKPGGWVLSQIQEGPFSGQLFISALGTSSGHALTIVGYNDDILIEDIDGNDEYTNDHDVNGDNVYNIKDFEKGAFRVANSMPNFGNSGFIWVPYKLFYSGNPGFAIPHAYGCRVFADNDPIPTPDITMKSSINHPTRDKLTCKVGYAQLANIPDPVATSYSVPFTNNGGPYTMRGAYDGPIEMGLNFSYFFRNMDYGKIFFIVHENDPENSSPGTINQFSIIDHRWGEDFELDCGLTDVSMLNGDNQFSIEYDLIPHEQPITTPLTFNSNMVSRFSPRVSNHNTLTVNDRVKIDMYNSELIIDEGCTLAIGNQVEFHAKRGVSKITINGNLQLGTDITFAADDLNSTIELYFNNGGQGINIDGCHFQKCIIHNGSPLAITNSDFGGSTINSHNDLTVSASIFNHSFVDQSVADLTITGSTFVQSSVMASNPTGGSIPIDNSVSITNNNFTSAFNGANSMIEIYGYKNYVITGNPINTSGSTVSTFHAIAVHYSGSTAAKNMHTISGNAIHCGEGTCTHDMTGITLYSSIADIGDNYIYNNYIGVQSLGNSQVNIIGNQAATNESETQRIKNNQHFQVYASVNAFPVAMHWNAIYGSNPNDCFAWFDFNTYNPSFVDITNNYWGPNFVPYINLCPTEHYNYLPIWNLNGGQLGLSGAQQLYATGQTQVADSNYPAAKSTFQQVVTTYPTEEPANHALKEILYLEPLAGNDFTGLKNWFLTQPEIINHDQLLKLANNLANKCDEKLERYPDAIAWYENVIQNPETLEDSIFAIIDLEHLYWQMGIDTTLRSTSYVGSMTQYKPKSFQSFKDQKDELLQLLYRDRKQTVEPKLTFDEKGALNQGYLLQNMPNPFSGKTTIQFNLTTKEAVQVEIKIFDRHGKIVKLLDVQSAKTGINTVGLDMHDLPSGMYYYSLFVNDRQTDSKKMVVVR